jgi:hypothetical protein
MDDTELPSLHEEKRHRERSVVSGISCMYSPNISFLAFQSPYVSAEKDLDDGDPRDCIV